MMMKTLLIYKRQLRKPEVDCMAIAALEYFMPHIQASEKVI